MAPTRFQVCGDWPNAKDSTTWGYVVTAGGVLAPIVARFPYSEAGQRAADARAKHMTFWAAMDAALAQIPIRTSFDYPPIPMRDFDWSAVTDNYDGADDSRHPIGHGATELAAINDLLDQVLGPDDELDHRPLPGPRWLHARSSIGIEKCKAGREKTTPFVMLVTALLIVICAMWSVS